MVLVMIGSGLVMIGSRWYCRCYIHISPSGDEVVIVEVLKMLTTPALA